MYNILLNKLDIETFQQNYKGALGFHHRAKQFLDEAQSESVIFNVASIALEYYLVALCNLYGVSPKGHNYGYLMDIIETVVDVPQKLNDEIRSLDSIFEIYLCSLESYQGNVLELCDSDKMLFICSEVEKLFDERRISSVKSIQNTL